MKPSTSVYKNKTTGLWYWSANDENDGECSNRGFDSKALAEADLNRAMEPGPNDYHPFAGIQTTPKISKTAQAQEAKAKTEERNKLERVVKAVKETRDLEKAIKLLRKEPLSQNRQEILDVLNYRNGDYYVGGMAISRICDLLGVHGPFDQWLRIEQAVRTISDNKIHKVASYLESYIQYMKKHPLKTCTKCGHAA